MYQGKEVYFILLFLFLRFPDCTVSFLHRPSRSRSTRTERSSRRSQNVSAEATEDEDDDTNDEEVDVEEDDDETEIEEEKDDEEEKLKLEMKTVDDLIARLMKHRHSWPFHEPVDAEEVRLIRSYSGKVETCASVVTHYLVSRFLIIMRL